MLTFNPIQLECELTRKDPLYVGHFFPLRRMHWKQRKMRQAMIISIALTWYRLMKKSPIGFYFDEYEIFLTRLSKTVSGCKTILERFFNINKIGYNFGGELKAPTIVSPRPLPQKYIDAIENIKGITSFSPSLKPLEGVSSTVKINNDETIIDDLMVNGRYDLIPAVKWLQQNEFVEFLFKPAGTLKARDTSIWPIKSIETWPSWLRSKLFGTSIDIEGAYIQFLLKHLEEKYKDKKNLLELLYPDLLKSFYDKKSYRDDICKNYLKLEINEDNIKIVKKILMSLANGSRISPSMIACDASRSDAVSIVKTHCNHLSSIELEQVGEKLSKINKQFQNAKKDLCIHVLNQKPSRLNQKKILKLYFDWEREARYNMWNVVGKTGLFLHDGLDGIILKDTNKSELIKRIENEICLKVSID